MAYAVINDGMRIKQTCYWDSIHARHGLFAMSGNAGAWRLLVPDCQRGSLPEMATAHHVDIETGLWRARPVATIWFDDLTRTPFRLLLEQHMFDRTLRPSTCRQPLLVYSRDGLQQEHMIHRIR
ncbi:hypothetical protein [Cereibacter azotoformans]|uniref:hypothetical protein n=1 Tax=Cereibacter azotoformans TaxID=43057 RepID=UPI001F460421|nr:hypothetical protein [Cereibacter azotoformans]